MRLRPGSKLRWVLAITTVLSWAVILGLVGYVLAQTMGDRETIGTHDWDQMESHRYLITKTILRYHQFPFWNPYACGGHPNWGGFESGTTVVSPWAPFYLLLSLPHALRVEVWGMALLSAVGAWLLAGRFTRSPAMRALVVVGFAVNGRWTLQISTGHTWHLAYAWTPWVLYFFDRAVGADASLGPPRRRYAVLAGACIAMIIYMGGIYPLPQTVLLIALYGFGLAATMRSARPIVVGLASGVIALGLSAPKLLPVLEVLFKHPRLVDSTEVMDFGAFADTLTSRDQDVFSGHGGVNQWGWHEWGMYVGWAIALATIVGVLFGRGLRETPAKWVGLLFFAFAFGSFDPHAPWPLLHHVPVFRSQHVPSRWMYPGILLLLVVTVSVAERLLRRSGRARGWLELALVPAVAAIAWDVGTVARQPIGHMFSQAMPSTPESMGPFHTDRHLPAALDYPDGGWSPPSLTAELANQGTIECSTFVAFHDYFRDHYLGHIPGVGARGVGETDYRGEVFVPEGIGSATVTHWTPNEVTVEVHAAQAGVHVVLNQNWDEGWSANGTRALNWSDTVAAPLSAPEETIVFRYRPPTFLPGIGIFLLTCGIIGWAWNRSRAATRPRPGPSRGKGLAVLAPAPTRG
jgi:hypothetical protein